MKKVIFSFLWVILTLFLLTSPAYGDIGPKPSVVIDFKGLEGRKYYVTLLSNVKSTGPFSAISESDKSTYRYQEGEENYDVFLKFAGYEDKDGFYFLQFFKECTTTHQFSWTYYPPEIFKILLYFQDTDSFIVSDSIYERYAFDSYFTASVSGNSITLKKSYDYSNEIISLIVRIVLTIGIELGIALLFGFRGRKHIKFIAIVNTITQIMLNVVLNVINYLSGSLAFLFFYFLLELLIFIIEAIIYSKYFKRISNKAILSWIPGMYAFVANTVSFVLGLGLSYLIPGIF